MTDSPFEFSFVPNTYADRVQRAAVLYPLIGRARSPSMIVQQVERLVRQWRRRLVVLRDAEWVHSEGLKSLQYARNCCPAFAYARPRTRPCSLVYVCPFCYARWVRDVWLRVDMAFPNQRRAEFNPRHEVTVEDPIPDAVPVMPPSAVPYQLIERHHTVYAPCPADPVERLLAIETYLRGVSQLRPRTIRRIKPRAAFMFVSVEPHGNSLRLRYRQLFMVAEDYELDPAMIENTHGHLRFHAAPSRQTIFGAVARVCRYPTRLMYGDPQDTALILRARQRLRFRASAMFGAFRRAREVP